VRQHGRGLSSAANSIEVVIECIRFDAYTRYQVTTDVGKTNVQRAMVELAAAPNAVGVFALLFKLGKIDCVCYAERSLSHIFVALILPGSIQLYVSGLPNWSIRRILTGETTAAGRPFSYKYGYGKIDAYDYVTTAKIWQNVQPQAWFDIPDSNCWWHYECTLQEMSGGELIVSGGNARALPA